MPDSLSFFRGTRFRSETGAGRVGDCERRGGVVIPVFFESEMGDGETSGEKVPGAVRLEDSTSGITTRGREADGSLAEGLVTGSFGP